MRSIRAAEATLPEVLRALAAQLPHSPAILAAGRPTLSHAALQAQIDRIASYLRDKGYGRSNRIAVVLPDGPELAVALLSVMSCATCVPLDPRTDAIRLRLNLERARVDAVIVAGASDLPALSEAIPPLAVELFEVDFESDHPAGSFALRKSDSVCGASTGAAGQTGAAARAARTPARQRPGSALRRPAPDDAALLICTSGTTGTPKLVPLSHRVLTQPILQRAERLDLGPGDRCLCVVPLFTTSGIRRALLPVLAAGGSIVCTAGFDAARFGEWLDEFAPTFLAGSPAVIDAALVAWTRQPPARSSLRFILSGSTALKPALQDEAERVLGIPIIQGLASAETGVVAQNPLPPGRRVPGSVGVPCGCEVAIVDSEWRQVAQGHEGSIAVRGPEVFEGYEQDPEANRSAFRDGWFRTGDIGYFDAEGYLFLTGRARELVNRGGFKVAPVEVDEVLLRHPDVADAAAFGVPHRTLGEDVVAVVTLRAGSDVEAAALRELLLASLAPYKVPSEIRVVTEIPRTALGKVRRTELAERFEAARRGAGPGGAEGPLDSVEEIVAACFSEVLQRPVTDRTASFYAEGGDSLQGTRVITRVNAAFGLALTPTDLLQRPTIAALADQVRAARSATVSEAASAPPALVPVTRRERLRTTRGTERSEAR